MQHSVQGFRDINVPGHIVLHQREVVPTFQMTEVLPVARDKVVHADNHMTISKKAVREMGPQETCRSRNQDAQSGLPKPS